jgi:hypothetical protein
MKTILIIHTENKVIYFDAFESKEDAQKRAIELMADVPSEVGYKLIPETEFIKLIKR